jgi:Rieske Fe-S protein
MTELERRRFLLWAAGVSFTAWSAGLVSGAVQSAFGLGDAQGAPKQGDPKKPASAPASKPASKPSDSTVYDAGDQKDGAFVLDPANPPKLDVKAKETSNATYVKVGKDTVIVAQSADKKTWCAVSGICTHKNQVIVYKPEDKIFRCPGHGSKFTEAGKVTKGPATVDLSCYDAKEVKGKGGKKFVRIAPKA